MGWNDRFAMKFCTFSGSCKNYPDQCTGCIKRPSMDKPSNYARKTHNSTKRKTGKS